MPDKASRNSLEYAIRSQISRDLGLAEISVTMVPPRHLPQTSSGKIRRSRVRAGLSAGEYTGL
jgi:acyl-CoA synthetase (AMP-forming)/AMP-acid ligase II